MECKKAASQLKNDQFMKMQAAVNRFKRPNGCFWQKPTNNPTNWDIRFNPELDPTKLTPPFESAAIANTYGGICHARGKITLSCK